MRTDLEALARKFAGNYSVDQGQINGHRAVALTFVARRGTYLRNKHFFLEYFGAPLKGEGEPVRVPEIVPANLVPFINVPLGRLLGTLSIRMGASSPEDMYRSLVAIEGGSRNPLVDLTNPQTLYAKTEGLAGRLQTVELAKVCPHQSNSTQMTVVLAGFYALPN